MAFTDDTFKSDIVLPLSPSPTDGRTLVPLFIKVRNKDLLFDKDWDFDKDLLKELEDTAVDEIVVGQSYLKFNKNNWVCKIYQDNSCELTTKLSLNQFIASSSSNRILQYTLTMPYTLSSDDEYTQISIETNDTNLMGLIASASYDNINSGNKYSMVLINVYNAIANFTNEMNKDAIITIRLTGKIFSE